MQYFETTSQLVALAAATFFMVPAAHAASEPLSRTRYLMGTTCEVVSDGPADSSEAAFHEIERVEAMLTTWREDSELASLNRGAGAGARALSHELLELLATTVDWSGRTNGAFDPVIRSLIEVWNVRGTGRLPSAQELETAMAGAGIRALSIDSGISVARLAADAGVDEGAFGKGYAIDRAMQVLVDSGCHECLINFGGQIAIRSHRPSEVSVASPVARLEPALRLTISDGSIATTSGSEKWFDTPAGRFSHIIDPRTGRALPPRGSATAVHESALIADIISTSLYVMGPDEGIRWADANGVAAIFIVPDGSRWTVLTSKAGHNPGLRLTAVSADFRLKGQH